jgi:hypothetical protein
LVVVSVMTNLLHNYISGEATMSIMNRVAGRYAVPFFAALAAGLFASLAIQALAEEGDADSKRPTIRIKAGSEEPLTDHDGNVWKADEGFKGGEVISRWSGMKIENTEDPELYRSERYSMESFAQKLPNGKYKVKLHFAETFEEVSGEGQRVFSFNVEGKEFKDFDIFKKAGGVQKAYIEKVPVDVTDGVLDVTFTPDVQNPAINGIEIIPLDEKKE